MLTRRRLLLSAASAAAASSAADILGSSRTLWAQSSAAPSTVEAVPAPIAALPSRQAEATPITLTEREERLHRARQLLAANKIDVLVICTGNSLTYFTGLRWGQSERFFAWALPVHGDPFIVCPVFEEGRVRERMEAKPPSLPAAGTTRVYTWNEDEDPYLLLTRALKDAGIRTGRIGIEEKTQFAFSDGMAHAGPGLTITSATPVTYGCRSIKSPAELALLQLANEVTLSVYAAAFRSLRPGMTNRHVVELINAGYGRSGFPGEASCQVATYSALPHGSLQPQTIHEGEIVLLDDGCLVEGYQSDISRSFVLGKASDRQKRVFDLVHKAQAAALAAGRPGVPMHAIDDAARKVIADGGFGPDYKYFSHRLGHGIGMDMHEWPYLVRGNRLPLAAGMCFSDEPGVYIPGEFGIRLEDDWHVTADGARMFTPQSPSLEEPFATV